MRYLFALALAFLTLCASSQVYTKKIEEDAREIVLRGFFTVSLDSLQNQLNTLFNKEYPDFNRNKKGYFYDLEVSVNPYGCIDYIEHFKNTRTNDTLVVILKKFFKEYHPCKVLYYENELTGNMIPIEYFFFFILFDHKGDIVIGID